MQKQVMIQAVEVAKTYEGDWVARMKMALRKVWAVIKKGTEVILEVKQVKLKKFDAFRFEGLNVRIKSNKYYSIDRVSIDKRKVVVNVGDSHLLETRYGYALILDTDHVVFIKDWQVNRNYYGNEVILNEQFFNVKKWGNFDDFGTNEENHKFATWLNVAKEQQDSGSIANWSK